MTDLAKQDFSNRVRRCALDIAQHGVAALGGLYDLTADRLVRYTYVITRNREDAEDAMQAAMAVSYTHLTLPTICSV